MLNFVELFSNTLAYKGNRRTREFDNTAVFVGACHATYNWPRDKTSPISLIYEIINHEKN